MEIGLVRRLEKFISIPAPDYTTLSLRICNLEIDSALFCEGKEEEG